MSFGLRNAGQTFQRFIDGILHGLDFCFAYIADILVFSANNDEHKQHLRILFQRLSDHGLLVNVSKSCLGKTSVTFLGYQVSSEGTRPLLRRFLRMWPAYYRELFTIYSAVQHFRHVLEAQHCTIYTDHKPITYAFRQRHEKLPPVQLNQLSFIGQLTTDIQHISGAENVVADAFSRIFYIAPPPVDLKAIAEAQKSDAELLHLQTSDNSLKLEKIEVPGSDVTLIYDTSMPRPRPFVPASERRQVFNALHGLSHPGSRATARLISTRFVWPRVQSDCRAWARACLHCQRSKITRHNSSPLQTFAATPLRFRYIHIDIIGPLPLAKSYRYCLTATDHFSRWVEAWSMESITAEDVKQTLFADWISRFGSPQKITTDQGRQFESQLLKHLGMFTAFKRSRTTSYHPCSNGMIERVHRQLKASLMYHTDSAWFEALPVVLLGIHSVFKEDLQSSSTELVYGEPLRLPGEFISPLPAEMQSISASDFADRLRTHISRLRPVPASCHARGTPFVFKDMETCSYAMLRDDSIRGAF
ncbi:uncharacterized protein K02A2.6 [Trichonephila clavipes]|nr:uncharacterized protein K02A2.6 [Trichonephila clavipes]